MRTFKGRRETSVVWAELVVVFGMTALDGCRGMRCEVEHYDDDVLFVDSRIFGKEVKGRGKWLRSRMETRINNEEYKKKEKIYLPM